MTRSSQGSLANLWAVGGGQTPPNSGDSDSGYYRYCPACGWQLTGKFSTCPRCSGDLRLRCCTYCGEMVPFGEDPCPRCSAPAK